MRRYLKRGATISFIISWLLLFGYVVRDLGSELVALIDTIDVARRLTAPDGRTTALLERDLHFDLNFRLYLVDTARPQPRLMCSKLSGHQKIILPPRIATGTKNCVGV